MRKYTIEVQIRQKLQRNFFELRQLCTSKKIYKKIEKRLRHKVTNRVDGAVYPVTLEINGRFTHREGRSVWLKKQRVRERNIGMIMWGGSEF